MKITLAKYIEQRSKEAPEKAQGLQELQAHWNRESKKNPKGYPPGQLLDYNGWMDQEEAWNWGKEEGLW